MLCFRAKLARHARALHECDRLGGVRALSAQMGQHAGQIAGRGDRRRLDGKTPRGSHNKAKEQDAVEIV